MLKETAYGIAATIAHPIDAGVAILHSTKKTVSQVGYLGGVFVQGVGYAFGGKQIEVNQEEFDKTAQDLSKSMVKTGVLAVVTTGIGEAAGASVKSIPKSAGVIETGIKTPSAARSLLQKALRKQNLEEAPVGGFKQTWSEGGYDYEVRIHPPQPNAPAGSNSATKTTFRVARREQGLDSNGQGKGWEHADDNGNWFPNKDLKSGKNPQAANDTHITL